MYLSLTINFVLYTIKLLKVWKINDFK